MTRDAKMAAEGTFEPLNHARKGSMTRWFKVKIW